MRKKRYLYYIITRIFYQENIYSIILFKQEVLENFWPRLKPMIPELFKGIDVKPSLLHGDLWVENTARWLNKPGCVFISHNSPYIFK